jgi:hypothetical protein
VKVGRAAFDEDAIRLLEESHPDLDFDWERILTTRPPAAPEPEEARHRRPDRRAVREARRVELRAPRPAERQAPSFPAPQVAPKERATPTEPSPAPEGVTPPSALPAVLAAPPIAAAPVPLPPSAPARRFVRVFDAAPETPEHHASEAAAVERILGAEQLTILRARYAEILARIAARGGDARRVQALREQAERANPDAWVTEAEVAAGLASVDAVLTELHQLVGRRRRRRRRRRDGGAPSPAGAEAGVALGPDLPGDAGDEADDEELAEGPDGQGD